MDTLTDYYMPKVGANYNLSGEFEENLFKIYESFKHNILSDEARAKLEQTENRIAKEILRAKIEKEKQRGLNIINEHPYIFWGIVVFLGYKILMR